MNPLCSFSNPSNENIFTQELHQATLMDDTNKINAQNNPNEVVND